ncbi:response regulator transcription factor [Marinoscillum furvescens]|uniref:DNA-binding response OmpR family regulator n=1 Tax=Marinoscillum furvescens DSM 4134 TaxID=1122208 RepID=A0A3D9L269_MARFU|nr:response regulator transcription factor [Marinoscillum furvescens]RED98818.1 DNA-binding response OmpR family regulator [Marinoscillum furvescens DSM 4134]
MKQPVILLAEDDENLSFVVADQLEQEGFKVVQASDGASALEAYKAHAPDLCLVDVMMPRMDGFTLAKNIRAHDELVPILFLTARSMEEDRLRGFEIGGDDYITKPFSVPELTHRIRVFLRRTILMPRDAEKFTIGTLTFDPQNYQLEGGGHTSQLTEMEAQLLQLLAENSNRLVKREDILIAIWGENDYFKGRSLDVFISRLRKYLKADSNLEIKNHHGVGFTLLDRNAS